MTYGEIIKWLKGLTHEGRVAQSKEKIESLFQVDNRVVHRRTGTVFTVCEVGTGQAILLDDQGDPVMTSWFTNGGRLKTEMADAWDIAPA